MTPDRHPDRTDRPEMDPERSAEIRALLISTVAGAPRPRVARLSRSAFALAATAALIFAGSIGAGTVVAYDRLTDSVVAQDSSTAEFAEAAGGESLSDIDELKGQDGSASGSEAASDHFQPRSDALTPVLTINGETGYAYPSDIELARGNGFLDATADTDLPAPGGQIPIYLADGVTVLAYFDPTRLLP